MTSTDSGESSGGEAADDPTCNKATKTLLCPDCSAKFPTLSKLNKHRNAHERPYECFEEGCSKAFSQKQGLDRHMQTKHSDTSNLKKYYHCTVDGCKYSSTGRKRKKFMRVDQVKEHIKEYGHYGPHSANDRPRRSGNPLLGEHKITARFEEWTVEENLPRRTIQSCQYNSIPTTLWHTDDIGELYLIKSTFDGNSLGLECPAVDCYFNSHPPKGCEVTLLKTTKGLREHYRRAHEASGSEVSSPVQLQEESCQHTVSSSGSMGPPKALLGKASFNLTLQPVSSSEPDLNHPAEHVEGGSCFCHTCFQNDAYLQSEYCMADLNPDIQCQCQSQFCAHRDFESNLAMEGTFELQSASYIPWSSYEPYSLTSNFSEDTMLHDMASTPNSTSSVFRHDSLKLRKSRKYCSVHGCDKSFSRKYELERHMESVHVQGMPYGCHLCERRFRRKDKLHEHVRKEHSAPSDSDSMKTNPMLSDLSFDWISTSTLSSSRDVAPRDTLVKGNSFTGSLTGEMNVL